MLGNKAKISSIFFFSFLTKHYWQFSCSIFQCADLTEMFWPKRESQLELTAREEGRQWEGSAQYSP